MILGIDPGVSGALALVGRDGGLIDVHDMPVVEVKRGKRLVNVVSPQLLAHLLSISFDGGVDLAVIEDVHAMPNQGSVSTFGFGRSLGVLEGAVALMGWPVEMVAPATWKKAMGLTKSKDASRQLALKTWPTEAGRFSRVKDDGRAEAALMALWGQRLLAERGVA